MTPPFSLSSVVTGIATLQVENNIKNINLIQNKECRDPDILFFLGHILIINHQSLQNASSGSDSEVNLGFIAVEYRGLGSRWRSRT